MKMKISIKASAIILLLFVSGIAQARVDQKVSIGLMANPLVTWMRIDNGNIEREKAKFGIEYGVITDINFTENYSLSTGISMMIGGGTINYMNGSLDTLDTSVKLNVQYINLPLYLKLKTNEIGYITYYGEFGIINSFRVRGRAEAERDPNPVELENSVNIVKKNNPLGIRSQVYNLALHIGGGIEYSVGTRTKIQAGLFYNNGFANIIKDNDDEKIFLNSFGLRIAVIF